MEIKGTALLAIRDFVKLNHSDQFEDWLNLLGEESKQIYSSSIDSTKWYPVDAAAIEPTIKIGQMFFENNTLKGAWESGRYSAQKGLNGIYKIFVKASSPTFIISRAKDVFARYYRPCEMAVTRNENKGVVLHMKNAEECNAVIEHRIGGWIEKALEISGVKTTNVDITKSKSKGDDYTEFTVSW